MKFSWCFVIDSVPFSKATRDGETSLGGSESACIGLARALAVKGHHVFICATKLAEDAQGADAAGVTWIPYDQLDLTNMFFEWDVFCVLRHPAIFQTPRRARLRVLWNQDLLNHDGFKAIVMAVAWAYDKVVYVSEFHRAQWEDWLPELKPLGHVTKNGYDPANVPDPAAIVKDPNRIIHISRPERGLAPLLEMWPAIRQAHPLAELHLCRYSSMYDTEGWGQVCQDFDAQAADLNARVGGITFLGELNKVQLHQAIAESAVMAYPGVHTFAETSCIAAIEAQANGTPFVGSWKGALPETVPGGILIPGGAFEPDYQRAFVAAVGRMLDGCARNTVEYRRLQHDGRAHVEAYTYAVIAAEWEAWVEQTFRQRYDGNKRGVLRQLLHYDDHTAAKIVAQEIVDGDAPYVFGWAQGQFTEDIRQEAEDALVLCDRVIRGEDQSAEDYAHHALDPITELNANYNRLTDVVAKLKDCASVVDIACGSGAYALGLARANPAMHVTAIDYAQGNIDAGRKAAEQLGVADRITWICAPVWDFATGTFSEWWQTFAAEGPRFNGLWCGEFVEHVSDCTALIDGLESVVTPGSPVVYTCPYGPLGDLITRRQTHLRGHVHHFGQADLVAVFGKKAGIDFQFLPWLGVTPRGWRTGNWLITYRAGTAPAGQRPYARQILTTRPKARLSVGILAQNAEHDLARCLDSVWAIADEIVIGDAGSTDSTRQIAESFARKVRVVPVTPVSQHPDGFSGSRNEVLAHCTGDWFLWLDTDEVLVGMDAVWQYLESGPFIGYSIHQNHLQLDAPQHYDKPIRLFQTRQPIQFYGAIHEQPQLVDCNGDIEPALEVFDVQIAHTGYLTVNVRRDKMLNRNLPLLGRDQDRFPDRRLGKVLVLRDYVNLADLDCEQHGDRLTGRARQFYQEAITLFTSTFSDPADKHHEIARPFYERALQVLKKGTEVEFSLAGKRGGLNGTRAKPARAWVQSPEEMQILVRHRLDKAAADMVPKPIRLDPIVPRVKAREAVSA